MIDYQVRAAGEQDNAALIALEKRSPLRVGVAELAFDRSPNYFAGARLQERCRYAVAEAAGGVLAGVCASAVHRAMLLGKECLLSYTHHERIAPDFQRMGIGGALPRWLTQSWVADGIQTARSYAYIDAKNEASLAFARSRGGAGPWPIDGWLQDMPAIDSAGAESLETLDERHANEVIALLNATHAGLELFPGSTRARLLARLARTPDYGWPHWHGIRLHGRLVAVAGLYDHGAHVGAILRPRGGGQEEVSRSMGVLDYGYMPGEIDAMLALLDGLRGIAAAAGRSTVEISVPESRPLYEPVMARASSFIQFKFLGGAPLPAPGDHVEGVYIDPAYL